VHVATVMKNICSMSMSIVHLYSAQSCSISTALNVLSNCWSAE